MSARVLVVGTADTKGAEIAFLRERIAAAGGRSVFMDVGVLGHGDAVPDITNRQVAAAAGKTLQQVTDSGDENTAMALMAQGAATLAAQAWGERRIDALLALGGTMGTDLALEVAGALPLGVPKVLLSTVAFSPLLPPQRIPPDMIMVLWAGGLYGLNSLCQSALSQAAGAAVGACRVAVAPAFSRPMVGMTSLGSSALKYMVRLTPALAERGYELAVFHTTGMGGRAFESLAAAGRFAAVMDFSLQELVNHLGGSIVSAGPDRLSGAGSAGLPQLVAPGATDMVDYPAWGAQPARFAGRPSHAHNRLIASVCIDPDMRREVARAIGERLDAAKGPTCLLLPRHGIEEWDRPGAPLHDPQGLSAFLEEMRRVAPAHVSVRELDAHINDDAFAAAALAVFDAWVAEGRVPAGAPR